MSIPYWGYGLGACSTLSIYGASDPAGCRRRRERPGGRGPGSAPPEASCARPVARQPWTPCEGLRTQAAQDFYDMVVVGAGPAGQAGSSSHIETWIESGSAPGAEAAPGQLAVCIEVHGAGILPCGFPHISSPPSRRALAPASASRSSTALSPRSSAERSTCIPAPAQPASSSASPSTPLAPQSLSPLVPQE